jgi:hypothetical protein
MGRVGLRRGALYLVRPDGYIALADSSGDAARLREYRSSRGPLGRARRVVRER